jgi:DNA-binding NarL/FixJ family response regulator
MFPCAWSRTADVRTRSGVSARVPRVEVAFRVARVLIVDDSMLIRKQLRETLSEAGHDVVGEAADGLAAPDRVRELRPDVITLDLIMPGRNGLATLQHLLQVDPSLAVVVCSASLDQRRVVQALRLGAQSFIVKPFGRESVLDAVSAALGDAPLNGNRTEHIDAKPSTTTGMASTITSRSNDAAIAHLHRACIGLADDLREILEHAIDSRKVTLEQILALEYEQLRGPLIAGLGRLFDVRRVPERGFDPPKFQTAYDAIIDRAMMERMDALLAAEPSLTFALPLDLNAYAPAHNDAFSADCTGDPAQDLRLNRTKRFFLDSDPLRHAARMDLGVELPNRRLSRADIARAGGHLDQPPPGATERSFLTSYERDTGAVLDTLSVPLYIKRQRWGVVTLGWNPDDLLRRT